MIRGVTPTRMKNKDTFKICFSLSSSCSSSSDSESEEKVIQYFAELQAEEEERMDE